MSYSRHVFFCTNQRANGSPCCEQYNSQEMRDYTKSKVKQLGLTEGGKLRINSAGCLGKCEKGPVMVIYPEGVWYTWVDKIDIDEIIRSHLTDNTPVKRLLIE